MILIVLAVVFIIAAVIWLKIKYSIARLVRNSAEFSSTRDGYKETKTANGGNNIEMVKKDGVWRISSTERS